MRVSRFALAASALSLLASPALAQAERASEPVTDASEMRGRGSSTILLILALAAIIAGIVIAVSGGDDDAVSP